jgi:NCAIR mutase (PurE)-related protein
MLQYALLERKREAMDEERLRELLAAVQAGAMSVEEGLARLSHLPYEDLGFAAVDHHRALRKGFPEVILGEGKTTEQVVAIAQRLLAQGRRLLVTRADLECYRALKKEAPDAVYYPQARAITVDRLGEGRRPGVAVVCAGTSDLPVAEEAAVTRLLDKAERLRQANAVAVVAGMEGALPSVVAGLVAAPVIAVPTSVGYGASFGGLAPLLAMLNACAPGVAVVNIDNGFGAGYLAAVINHLAWQGQRE